MKIQVLDKFPEGFVPRQQWPEYDLLSTTLPSAHPELVGENPRGIRWGKWPFYFEEYWSDIEPDLSLSNCGNPPKRVIVWNRIRRTGIPPGWHKISKKRSGLDGVAILSENGEYFNAWSSRALYDRRKWRTNYLNNKYRIEKVLYPEFRDAYNNSRVSGVAGNRGIDIVGRMINGAQNKYVELWSARSISSGGIHGGIATISSSTHNASYYLNGFLRADAGNAPVMTGLIDYWFSRSRDAGIRYMHLGSFWRPGKPNNWKGFSKFKAKFATNYILYQPMLIRFL